MSEVGGLLANFLHQGLHGALLRGFCRGEVSSLWWKAVSTFVLRSSRKLRALGLRLGMSATGGAHLVLASVSLGLRATGRAKPETLSLTP